MLNDSIRVFLTVVDKKSFSKAAKALFLTQPAVSFQIQTLEEYYSTRLFDRINRHISLTESGKLLLDYSDKMTELQSDLEREMQELTGTVKGRLLVGASTTIGEYLAPQLLGAFKKKYPEVDLILEVGNTEDIESKIHSTNLDIGLVEGPVTGKDIEKEFFIEDHLCVITSVNHPWAKEKSISIFELDKYPLISREKGSGTRKVYEDGLKKAGFPPNNLNISMEFGSTNAIKAAVANDLGISIISKWAAKEKAKLGRIAKMDLQEVELERPFNIIYHKKKFHSQATDGFLKFLKSDEALEILEQ
ncbi:transcriptional regulator, LysR family [Desulfonispora thiosulfatigenes DSM 11270]|uniref:Transcriptional regulator, LysR family n=1 Tax=Desulfonispora thiosulfatigenes DSM 11270 TaxID=656914 RepID=A0A1W1VK34_DESTI|nr:selenium metabolism-associated LysR family transcriptional regulator [Desulfonispora thiosulfatigenes]SMB93294.1 transcriptional regulator, LysR family [Desulfonispora thiosulfatigenes DSM 11270]